MNAFQRILFVIFFPFVVCKHPVVLIHGILSTKDELREAQFWFSEHLNREVYSIEIGNGKLDSVFLPMNSQLDILKSTIDSIDTLKNNQFHIIGFSQGGLLARAFAQRSNFKRIKTLMTFGTPHMGVYYYSDQSIYSTKTQSRLSYSNYWKDPYMYPLYLQNCSFLPALNGEVDTDLNLNDKVDNFVMVWSMNDEVIRPIESGKYEYFEENTDIIIPFVESETYKKNFIGIQKMFDEKRIYNIETNCQHRNFKTKNCLEKYKNEIIKFLL
jgi:palmitoyl-protein thioesterase